MSIIIHSRYKCSNSTTDGTDYVLPPTDLTFPTGSQQGSMQCAMIAIIDDVAVENEESFHVQLTTNDARVEFSPIYQQALLSIVDNDGKIINYCMYTGHCMLL